jgi:uncharacterized protein
MKLRVEGLSDTPVVLSERVNAVDFPALAGLEEGGECRFLEPLKLDFSVQKEFDHVRVQGRVATRVGLTCSRCLAEYETELLATFTVFYSKASKMQVEEEVALAEEDLVSASYDGEYIDFTSEIEEQVLLEIPYKPLCREDCKGLCVTCGADLNSGECGCDRSGAGFTFSALKNFTVKR